MEVGRHALLLHRRDVRFCDTALQALGDEVLQGRLVLREPLRERMLGRDRDAAALVRTWATMREAAIHAGLEPERDLEKVGEARVCADEMERYWRNHADPQR